MSRRSSLALFLVVAAIASVMRAAAQPSPVKREILDFENRMNAICAANDLANYFAFYGPDFTPWLPDGRTDLPQYKKQWTAFIQAGRRIKPNQISDIDIQIGPSEDTAIRSCLAHVKTRSEKGKLSEATFHEADLWSSPETTP